MAEEPSYLGDSLIGGAVPASLAHMAVGGLFPGVLPVLKRPLAPPMLAQGAPAGPAPGGPLAVLPARDRDHTKGTPWDYPDVDVLEKAWPFGVRLDGIVKFRGTTARLDCQPSGGDTTPATKEEHKKYFPDIDLFATFIPVKSPMKISASGFAQGLMACIWAPNEFELLILQIVRARAFVKKRATATTKIAEVDPMTDAKIGPKGMEGDFALDGNLRKRGKMMQGILPSHLGARMSFAGAPDISKAKNSLGLFDWPFAANKAFQNSVPDSTDPTVETMIPAAFEHSFEAYTAFYDYARKPQIVCGVLHWGFHYKGSYVKTGRLPNDYELKGDSVDPLASIAGGSYSEWLDLVAGNAPKIYSDEYSKVTETTGGDKIADLITGITFKEFMGTADSPVKLVK